MAIKSIKQPTVSKEDKKLLSQIYQSLDKVNANTKRFTTIKNIYISAVLPLANDCANKKYVKFTATLVGYLLAVDPSNKNIQELLSKLDMGKNLGR